jgi:hypothetical protein
MTPWSEKIKLNEYPFENALELSDSRGKTASN